ncbi:MAG: hypothetical protein IT545_03465, partial [Rhodobacteraceae bacterium]|nr:hypothetical protein [Paracoccaceae bacterium]
MPRPGLPRGAEGFDRAGSHFTGIKGVLGVAGRPVEAILPVLRDRNHPHTADTISGEEMRRVATFPDLGLVDMREFIDSGTRIVRPGVGDPDRGRVIFQTICAACHGFDGRALDRGEGEEHNVVGTEAAEFPDEVNNTRANAH